MSVRVMTKIWDANFPTPAMTLVALKLADHANDDGENVYPSTARVAKACNLSVSTVEEAIASMIQAGLLKVENSGHGNRTGRSTVIKTLDLDIIRKIEVGELVWQRDGRKWLLQPADDAGLGSAEDHPPGDRGGAPPEIGGAYYKAQPSLRNVIEEPPLNSPHLSAGGTSEDKCSEAAEGEPSEFDGWARGWDNAARSAVDEIRGSATSAHVASEFVDRVRATRFPSRQVDGASFVRQLRSRLGKFSAETLQAVAVHCLERHSRALPDVAALVTVADGLERRKRIAAAPATPAGDGEAGQAFRAALERRKGPDWQRAWGVHLTIARGEGGRACIAAAEAWRAKYVLSQCYDDLLGAAREALGAGVTRVEMGRAVA